MMRVETRRYELLALERDLGFAPLARLELRAFRALAGEYEHGDVRRGLRGSRSPSGFASPATRTCRTAPRRRSTSRRLGAIVTSPPYDLRARKVRAAVAGTSRLAPAAWVVGVSEVPARVAQSLIARELVVVVVNGRRVLGEVLERAVLRLRARQQRPVSRWRDRRAREYFENVLVAGSA